MSDERPKRGPYKRYLTNEDAPIPKTSRLAYQSGEVENHEENEGAAENIDENNDRFEAHEDCLRDQVPPDPQEVGAALEVHIQNPVLENQQDQAESSDSSTSSHSEPMDEDLLDLQSPSRSSSCSSADDEQSVSNEDPPALMQVGYPAPPVENEADSSNDSDNGGQDVEERSQEDEQENEAQEDASHDAEVNVNIYLDQGDTDVDDPEELNQQLEAGDQLPDVHQNVQAGEQDEAHRVLRGHESLWKAILTQQHFTSPLGTEVRSTPAEILLKILAVSQQNNLSFKAFMDTVRLVNSLFASPVIPGTQYLLDKLLLSSNELKRFFYCKNCSHSFGNVNHETNPVLICPECQVTNHLKDLTKATYFVLFPLESQLELLFMSKEIRENLVDPKEAVRRSNDSSVLTDVYSGKFYKEFAASLPDHPIEKVLSCVLCTDGSPLFKSSNYSIWPCFLCINELPPLLRMKNLLLGGLWFGNKHPPMDLYLKPVVDHLLSLSRGFTINVEAEVWQMKLYNIACCVDSGARGPVQGINSHSGYYPCNWCLIPGKWLDKVIFPFREVAHEARTHDGVIDNAKECLNSDNLTYVYGVQFASPLVKLPKFDIVKSMVQDFPHNVPFGIARTFLDEWLHNSKRSFYVGSPGELSILNARMDRLTPCIEVRRAVRLLKDMAFWKAREFENWIVFFSIIIMFGVLPDKFWSHWSLLVQAVYLLTRECVSIENVNTAHRLIRLWVADVERLYGDKYMTFNVHILLHLAENVARWGPSWAVSTYCFESAIGMLKNILHAQRGVPHQVHREISYKQAKHILLHTCQTPRTESFLESIASKPNKNTKYHRLEECVAIGIGVDFVPNDEESFLMAQPNKVPPQANCIVFSKIIANRCVYTSDSAAVGRKFNNSVALTTSGNIVIIKKFIVDKDTDKAYVFCVEALCSNDFLKFPQGIRVRPEDHCVRIVTSIGHRLKLISVKDLKIVCVVTRMEENMYVTPFHNLYNVC